MEEISKDGSDKLSVNIRTLMDGGSKIITLDVELNEIVHSLKLRISEMEGIPVTEQRLIYAGRDMDNERRVSEYNITQKDNLLYLVFRLGKPMILFYKTLGKGNGQLNVRDSYTIERVKELIGEQIGYPGDRLRAIFAGKAMEDHFTLSHYNIQHEATIGFIIMIERP